jgi:hypothetical protein
MKEALSSSETSVLTRATWRNIPEDDILLKSRLYGLSRNFVDNRYIILQEEIMKQFQFPFGLNNLATIWH